KACRVLGDWRLEDCTMYVTLEPCPMCAGAIVQARVPKVVIACMNPKAGCAGSVLDMFHEDGFNHQVETEVGLMGEVCSQMLKDFFKELREEGKRKKKEAKDREAGRHEEAGAGMSGDHDPHDPVHESGHGDKTE
ncbi:MAG: nucleoside deaminase, partial [Lachnospiraceae bacterium]|nr:nucleoside deaminase [Lachnospiraceae bacterium]